MKLSGKEREDILTKLYKIWPNCIVSNLTKKNDYIELEIESSQRINATLIMNLIRQFNTSNINIIPTVIYGGYCDTCSYEAGGFELVIGPENDIALFKSTISFLKRMEKLNERTGISFGNGK